MKTMSALHPRQRRLEGRQTEANRPQNHQPARAVTKPEVIADSELRRKSQTRGTLGSAARSLAIQVGPGSATLDPHDPGRCKLIVAADLSAADETGGAEVVRTAYLVEAEGSAGTNTGKAAGQVNGAASACITGRFHRGQRRYRNHDRADDAPARKELSTACHASPDETPRRYAAQVETGAAAGNIRQDYERNAFALNHAVGLRRYISLGKAAQCHCRPPQVPTGRSLTRSSLPAGPPRMRRA